PPRRSADLGRIPHGGAAAAAPSLPPPPRAAGGRGAGPGVRAPAPPEAAPNRVRYARAKWDAAAGDRPDAREACRDAHPAWPPSVGRDGWVRDKSVVREPERWAPWEFRDAAAPAAAASRPGEI